MTDDRYGKTHTDGSRSGGQPLNDSIEAKALALLNDVLAERVHWQMTGSRADNASIEALCRAIEQNEAYKQEVSDAVEYALDTTPDAVDLRRFIIPKPKSDPLVEVIAECDDGTWETKAEYANKFRAALEARGLEIREKGQ
jgi:hypothetical protein